MINNRIQNKNGGDISMNIDFKDEYATLRQEMLNSFERIHDTAKYGIGAFIAFLAFYYSELNFNNDALALLILQLIVLLMGISFLRLFQSVYVEGTYIALIIENGPDAKWHRMSRSYNYYIKDKGKEKWQDKLPFPVGKRWGADSAQYSFIILILTIIALSAVYSKTNVDLWAFLISLKFLTNLIIFINLVLLSLNIIIFYKLLWGMKNFREDTDKIWKEYYNDFGRKFKDPYNETAKSTLTETDEAENGNMIKKIK